MITANLDRPRAGDITGCRINVVGWAVSEGSEVVRIECYIDGTFRGAFRPQHERPDVVAAGVAGATALCGFSGRLDVSDLSPGKHLLRVAFMEETYQTSDVEVLFYRSELPRELPSPRGDGTPPKIIAFYLPQYHPIPENNAWWGPGFTEWTNVARARPLYRGHYQPHVPADLGFYDLRLPEARVAQVELARAHGIYGFAYYYYWFNGKRLLERPLNEVLTTKAPQFPFCVCYANENWTRRWDGLNSEVLKAQHHSGEDDRAFIRDLLPMFRDERYIRVSGRPLLIVYRPSLFPDPRQTAAIYREECVRTGEAEPYLAYAQSFGNGDPAEVGFDAAIEFPPLGMGSPIVDVSPDDAVRSFRGSVFDYEDLVETARAREGPSYALFRGVTPSWDNTPRKGVRSSSFVNASPEGYRRWLQHALAWTIEHHQEPQRFVFVNAWNEWGEGCHLEPDIKYGRLYLEATLEAQRRLMKKPPPRPRPKVSVIIPSYNHERFIERALASVLNQTLSDFEVIVVDDGSTDGTIAAAQAFLRSRAFPQRVTIRAQANAGAHIALTRGIEEATGEFIAVLNSDDAYELERLGVLVTTLEQQGADLAFSRVRYYDENENDVTHSEGYAGVLFGKQLETPSFPDVTYALLDFNVSISTGNFVFRRDLFEKIGGFVPLVLTHDWHFVLSACRLAKVVYVPLDLYRYRIHGSNSYRGYGSFGSMEGRLVMTDFFADREAVERLMRKDPEYFTTFVTARNLQGYGAPSDKENPV